MPDKNKTRILLTLFLCLFFHCKTYSQYPSINAYRAGASVNILEDIEELVQKDELYRITPYLPDIALMVKTNVRPYPNITYQSGDSCKKFTEYEPQLVESFKTLDPSYQAEAFAALYFFGKEMSYKEYLGKIIEELKKDEYSFYQVIDDQVAIMAAAGFYELAEKTSNDLGDKIAGDRVNMHLAVTDAFNKRMDKAFAHASKAIEKTSPEYPEYETIRQFFHLVEILGKNQEKDMALQLIDKFPEKKHQLVALAYFAKGLNDHELLRKSAHESILLEKDSNYPLEEIGVIAAQMKETDLAKWCIERMDRGHSRQNPIHILTEIAKTTQDKSYLELAKKRLGTIPYNAKAAQAEALTWITLTAIELHSEEAEIVKLLNMISGLMPQDRIKFHLRLLNIPSQRYYTGYS